MSEIIKVRPMEKIPPIEYVGILAFLSFYIFIILSLLLMIGKFRRPSQTTINRINLTISMADLYVDLHLGAWLYRVDPRLALAPFTMILLMFCYNACAYYLTCKVKNLPMSKSCSCCCYLWSKSFIYLHYPDAMSMEIQILLDAGNVILQDASVFIMIAIAAQDPKIQEQPIDVLVAALITSLFSACWFTLQYINFRIPTEEIANKI